jgi:hypothetical protein
MYEAEQLWRGQNTNMDENAQLGIYYGLEAPVATLEARIFGDVRLSDEDRRVFMQALPTVTNVGQVAEQKFMRLPNIVQTIAERIAMGIGGYADYATPEWKAAHGGSVFGQKTDAAPATNQPATTSKQVPAASPEVKAKVDSILGPE